MADRTADPANPAPGETDFVQHHSSFSPLPPAPMITDTGRNQRGRTLMLDMPDFNTTGEDPPRAPAKGGWGRGVVILLLLAAAAFGVRHYTGRAAALAAADRANGVKPVLLMFTADWCGPCQSFKSTVLADDRVVAAVVGSCKLQMVDLTKWEGPPADVAGRYGVRSIPTLVLVNSRGQEIDRYRGPHDAATFARWLDGQPK